MPCSDVSRNDSSSGGRSLLVQENKHKVPHTHSVEVIRVAICMRCYLQKHLGDAWTNSVLGSCQDIVVGNLRLELE